VRFTSIAVSRLLTAGHGVITAGELNRYVALLQLLMPFWLYLRFILNLGPFTAMLTTTLESIRARLPSSHMQKPSIPTMNQRISRVTVVFSAVLISFGLASVIAGPSAYAQSPRPGSTVEGGLAAGAAFPQANRLGNMDVANVDVANVDVAEGTNSGLTAAGSGRDGR